MAGEEAAKNSQAQKDGGGDLHAEPEGFFYSVVFIGAVVEAAHRLEAWPKPMRAELANIMIRLTTDMAAIAASP